MKVCYWKYKNRKEEKNMKNTNFFGFNTEIKDSKLGSKIKNGGSSYNPSGKTGLSTISPTLYNALKRYSGINAGMSGYEGALGYDKNGNIVAEVPKDDIVDIIIYSSKNILAGTQNKISGTMSPYTIGKGKRLGTAIMFALIPILLEDTEFKETYDEIKDDILKDESLISDFDEYERRIAILSDNVYRRYTGTVNTLPLKLPNTGNLSRVTNSSILSGMFTATDTIAGEFMILVDDGTITAKEKEGDRDKFLKKFRLTDESPKDFEKSYMRKLPDTYVIPEVAMTIAKTVKNSLLFEIPMMNFYLYGPSGTGKTELANSLSVAFNRPKATFTCGVDTDWFSLIGQMIPNTKKKTRELPVTIEDIMFDFEASYKLLTGEETIPVGYTKEECIELYVSLNNSCDEPDFYFQESPIIKAMRYGWLLEIQEITVCKPAALECLNSLLEYEGELTLPTGETIRRDPKTVVILTANTMYAGNREVNQSIISRMAACFRLELPSNEIIVKRVISRSELKDEKLVEEMVTIGSAIEEHCKSLDMGGMCGMRELINWANYTAIFNNPYQACIDTVINKIGSDEDFQQELIASFLDTSSFAA